VQHIPVGIIKSKHREFLDLQQGNQSVYAYSKMFNHLAQYALEQVDTDEKKKYRFMNDLSTKLQERLALNADWTFLELVSNPLLQMMPTMLIRKARRRRHWWPQLTVLLTSTRWYVHDITTHQISWLLVHRRIRISCLEL
jgi:hypothetical protein